MINPLLQCIPDVSDKTLLRAFLAQYAEPLCVDVGAAAGFKIDMIFGANPKSRIVCFEPFEGNLRYLREKHGEDRRVRIVESAVSDFTGEGALHVRESVTEAKGFWGTLPGYSSLGRLVPREDSDELDTGTIHDVPVVTLDDEITSPVRYLKIDVQGGEAAALRGAKRLFDEHGVDIVFCEYCGDNEIIEFFLERDYTLFDGEYLFIPNDADRADKVPFSRSKPTPLSTGKEAYVGTVLDIPHSLDAYATFFQATKYNYGYLQTDLICVRPSALESFYAGLWSALRAL